MAASQPIAGEQIKTGSGEEADAESDEQQVEHGRSSWMRRLPVAGDAPAIGSLLYRRDRNEAGPR
jgi:hypothetical protein